MDVQILQKKDNPLLSRVEVTFKAIHRKEPTPTRSALRAELAKALKATKEIVVVSRARPTFGKYETLGYAKLYKSKEQALAVERRHILVRNALVAAEAKPKEGEAAPKAEKPARAPAKKEERKPEAKAEPKAEHKPEPKAEAKPAPKEEKKAPAKAEAKPEAKKPEPRKKEGK